MGAESPTIAKTRHRRAQSVTRAEEIRTNENKSRRSQPDKPIHKPRDSLFSWSSKFNNFTGLVNWGFLLLTMGGFRLLLENFIKYGIRIDPMQWFIVITGDDSEPGYPSFRLLAYTCVTVVVCFLVEKGLALEVLKHNAGMLIHLVNIFALVLLPIVKIQEYGNSLSLIGAMTVCFTYSILFMKLWSYIQVNMWCRQFAKEETVKDIRHRTQSVSIAQVQHESNGTKDNVRNSKYDKSELTKGVVKYPDNLHLKDLMYFLCAPTLCYELNFPRTERIRKRFLIKRLLEVIIGANIVMGLFQQWMIPSVKNSLVPFSNMDYAKTLERLLKLAIPNHFMWLCFFYLTFHSFYNLLGEIMYFADRNFYCDWWNSNNIDTFWRTWNMPVHRWCVRHVYIPITDLGYGRFTASLIVFFISAFFHEYLVSVPLKTFKVWAFMGMMAQLPLSVISKFMEKNVGERWGNMVVWASIILGQPLCIMMYYHDYMVTTYGTALVESFNETNFD